MSDVARGELLRAPLFHTPRNPFRESSALADAYGSRIAEIVPDVEGVELQDWSAYDRAVDAGYRAAMTDERQ